MTIIRERIGKNIIYQRTEKETLDSCENIVESWTNSFNFIEESNNNKGLRKPQLGALFAIKSHWSVSNEPATIVMPTGTGKTETILSVIVSERCKKVLILLPSNLLREQLTKKSISLGILKSFGIVNNNAQNPIVACLKSKPNSKEELKQIIDKSNIIISTVKLISLFSDELLDTLVENSTELIVDEAHHIVAKTWNKVKYKFKGKRVLQFTATPFRNDEKKVDGKIIYNYPLKMAQEEGYFKPINFKSILEFDNKKSDLSIAKSAVAQLKEDESKGYKHIILVRCNNKKRAKELFEDIYMKYFKEYGPVLIDSSSTEKQKKISMEKIHKYESKILVCVDMFGEGIDIPNLKIAAIHDKYKSLPITLQFIGRFARSSEGLGNATVIANIAQDDVKDELKSLYSQDSDWNILLHTFSTSSIEKEVELQELINKFDRNEINEINLNQLIPKVSMMPYKINSDKWNCEKWTEVLDEQKCKVSINEEDKIIIIVEMKEEGIVWTNNKNLSNIKWNLYIIYWNIDKNIAFINSTDKSICNRLMSKIFDDPVKIRGEDIFKCLHGIKKLMLATVGLNTVINGPIRYKMFTGVDIAEAITEAQRGNSTKSNLFGLGYNGKGKISIGCSYKGTIWARWIETIEFWKNWCDEIAEKILNRNIDTNNILKGVLVPKTISERPKEVPISIEYPIELDYNNDEKVEIVTSLHQVPIYETELKIINNTEIDKPIRFKLCNDNFEIEYEMNFKNGNASFKRLSKTIAKIRFPNKNEINLVDYFNENPPRIRFANQSTLEGNTYIDSKEENTMELDKSNIEVWDFSDIDIHKESQKMGKVKDSIQYKVISKLKDQKDYAIIFDDDGSGEIADIVAIREESNKIKIEYYHCKYAKGEKPGSRIDDLYEVCGQAQKSVEWNQNGTEIIKRMIKRELKRKSKIDISKFEVGDMEKLNEILNKLAIFDYTLDINIVQPGVDSNKITVDMNKILCVTKKHLMDTYGIKFKIICS